MFELETHLKELEQQFNELEQQFGSPDIASDPALYKKLAKKHSDQKKIIEAYRLYKETHKKLEEARLLADDPDPEMAELAKNEAAEHEAHLEKLEQKLQVLLLPKDPNDEKNILLEIRAGTGGEEAALFAGDLFRAYARYAETLGWSVEIMSEHRSELNGFKEVVLTIQGDHVYSRLKYESGAHRVQRVPETESSGRIHTSAITVAVLPEAEDVEVEINPEDLRIDVYRSTGPGGQSVNTTDSAVRVTHVPSGIVASCQDEKSQHKNKARALKVLKTRLLDYEISKQQQERSAQRRSQVGAGDRSERIRTYNFPQNRVTDHRINLTLHKLDSILEGDLAELIEALIIEDQMRQIKALSEK